MHPILGILQLPEIRQNAVNGACKGCLRGTRHIGSARRRFAFRLNLIGDATRCKGASNIRLR
jgi:hypothetical protein